MKSVLASSLEQIPVGFLVEAVLYFSSSVPDAMKVQFRASRAMTAASQNFDTPFLWSPQSQGRWLGLPSSKGNRKAMWEKSPQAATALQVYEPCVFLTIEFSASFQH